jgi:hypothetical protein
MGRFFSQFVAKTKVLAVAAILGVASLASTAHAQVTPPDMAAVEFPVSIASIVLVLTTAGGLLLLAYFGPKIGFSFIKKLLARLQKAV